MIYQNFYKDYEKAAAAFEAGNPEGLARLHNEYLPVLGAQFFRFLNNAKLDYTIEKAKRLYRERGEALDTETVERLLLYDTDNHTRAVTFVKLVSLNILTLQAIRDNIAFAYVASDNTPEEAYITIFKALKLSGGVILPGDKDKELYEALADNITIYRGQSERDYKSGFFGASWTLKIDMARFFAFRYITAPEGPNIVLRATIQKADILAVFTGRGEDEIIVAGDNLKDAVIVERGIKK